MAPVKTINGTQLLVQVGDGAEPEVFAADCLINTERGIAFASDTNEFVIPDCLDPDTPAWKEVTMDGLSAAITGSGMLHTSSIPDWDAWFRSGETKNVRVLLNNVVTVDGGGHWEGAYLLTGWEITGTRNEKAQVSVTLASSGVVTWVDAA
ncbi:MAG: phage tail tube protein [Aurantimonas endophytica]|uniref:phage tail tube protein n=1 Tax=Aurantimonas endophytica TaxID=1522175 RepID=UPI0030012C6B